MRWILFLCCCSFAYAQSGTEPKPKAEDYESHGQAKNAAIGAEFMVHSFSGHGEMYIAKDFLVVEVALYPPPVVSATGSKKEPGTVTVNGGALALRVNGKKQLLPAVAPSMVAATLTHPEWQSGPHLEGGGGMGNTGVILGRPVPSQGPGGQGPVPSRAPRAPDPDNPSGIDPEPRVKPEELVVQTALPTGPHRGPVSGFVYFPYKGKPSGIKTLELLYEDAVVNLK